MYYVSPLGAYLFGGYSRAAWKQARYANRLLKSTADELLADRAAGTDRIARIICHQLFQITDDQPKNLIPEELRPDVDEPFEDDDAGRPPLSLIAAGAVLVVLTAALAAILSSFGASSATSIVGILAISTFGLWLRRHFEIRWVDALLNYRQASAADTQAADGEAED